MKLNLKINLLIVVWLMMLLSACGPAGAAAIQEGNEAFAQQDYAGALEAYKTAMKDAPDTGEPFYNAANTHYRQQDYDLAELRARQSLQHADDELSEDAYFNLGNSLFQAQQYEAAIAAYEEVLWRNPQAEDAKQNLELAWQQLQQEQQEQQQDQQSEEGDQEQQQDQQSEEDDQEQQQEQQSEEGDQEEEEQDSSSSEESDSEEAAEEEEASSSAGEAESPEQSDEEQSQPQPSEGGEETSEEQPMTVQLTPAQAAQLLESAAREAETLQQYLQQQPINNSAVEEDW